MQLTILVDNNTLIDRYFLAEPGLSFLLEDGDVRVLFDTGYSDIFLRNAQKLGLDLSQLDYVALSHGHQDHTWGLEPLIRLFAERDLEKLPSRRPIVVAHPRTFVSVRDEGFVEAGSLLSEGKLAKHFEIKAGTEPRWLTPRLVFLGEIPRRNGFEGALTFGRKEGEDVEDTVPEDSALAYRSPEGLVVLAGCAHAGICNTIEYAKEVCGEDRVLDVIGGFHLQEPPPAQLQGTLAYFRALRPRSLHACHCTDLASKIALAGAAPLEEVGVGLRLLYA
jgi:7,8-dihydropterin-6-yl-methyl-4-(beta-D-ribofuranosyl)aminobenzene 5'-phosphate synthase